jgi:hypothetical protein
MRMGRRFRVMGPITSKLATGMPSQRLVAVSRNSSKACDSQYSLDSRLFV